MGPQNLRERCARRAGVIWHQSQQGQGVHQEERKYKIPSQGGRKIGSCDGQQPSGSAFIKF